MDEKMTWNPTCPKMDKVSWSPLKSGKTTSRGFLAGFSGSPCHTKVADWFIFVSL
jgi:hypothetical protein